MSFIGFNKPYVTGKELEYISDAVSSKKLSGNGKYTQKCQQFFETHYGIEKCLLTSSCTDALEMAALLIDIEPGDEVIMPSYTFVSTANAFVLRGAKIVFADSRADHPGVDEKSLENLITPKTKAIVVVHYAGVACDMDIVMEVATRHNLFVIEDAAQAIDSFYTGRDGVRRALGSIGHLAAFSFHETKNIISGEGGLLAINDKRFKERAEIIWEKGTNRSAFFRGEVDKYGWVDVGSSFLPSEITAAFLWAQLEHVQDIQSKRLAIWDAYLKAFQTSKMKLNIKMPSIPSFATKNGHMFYILFESIEQRNKVVKKLLDNQVQAVFHYLSLHKSKFYASKHDNRMLQFSDFYSDTLLRLPLYYDLEIDQVQQIVNLICEV